MVMLGGAFEKGFKKTPEMKRKAERTRMINRCRKLKGLPPLSTAEKKKLNKGDITIDSLMKDGGFDDTMQYVAGFDDTMQYVAGGASKNHRSRRGRKVKGAGFLGNVASQMERMLGESLYGLGEGGFEMGGAVPKSRRHRRGRKVKGAGLLGSLGEIGDSVFGLGESGVEMGGAVPKSRRRGRKVKGAGLLGSLGEIGDSVFGLGEGGVEMGGGLLGSLGEIGDSVFGLGEGGGVKSQKRHSRQSQLLGAGIVSALMHDDNGNMMTGSGFFSNLLNKAKQGAKAGISLLQNNPQLLSQGASILSNVLGQGGAVKRHSRVRMNAADLM